MKYELMLAAYREQNPDHEEEFKKHKGKPEWQLKKEIDALATKEPRIWQGNVTVTGSFYRAGNVTQSAGKEIMQILLCVLRFYPATPVIAMDKLLRMEPLGAYKPEVFEEWIPSVHLNKGSATPVRDYDEKTLRVKKNHYKAKLFTGDTSPAAVAKLSDAANEEKSAVAAGKGKAPMPAPKKTPTQSQPGSSADHAQLPPEDTNEDLYTTALEAVPEEEGEEEEEEDTDLPSQALEVEELPLDPTPVDTEEILDEMEYEVEVDEDVEVDTGHTEEWKKVWVAVKKLKQNELHEQLIDLNQVTSMKGPGYKENNFEKQRRLAIAMMEDEGNSHLVPDEFTDAMVGFLKPGSRRRRADLNGHWESSLMQDWPHSDIYEPSVVRFMTAVMSDGETAAKREKFGGDIDVFFASTDSNTPTEITGVKKTYGNAKRVNGQDIRELLITSDNPVCRRNLARILCIYFDDENGMGSRRSVKKDEETEETGAVKKQEYMRLGVNVTNGAAGFSVTVLRNKKTITAWKPVFSAGLPTPGDSEYDTWKQEFDFVRKQHEQKTDVSAETLALLQQLKSNMTVGEWITTPFHYEYLPYQPVHAMFQDGETYSSGCLRCARSFYEQEFVYVADSLQTKGKCRSWPVSWFKNAANKLAIDAPLPFSAPENWPAERIEPSASDRVSPWDMFAMKLSPSEKTNRKLDPDNDKNTFKKTTNYAFGHIPATSPIWQGRMEKSRRVKVSFGMRGYQLKRANKFCNCCSDCATVLTTAPGLFIKNFQGVPYVKKKRGDPIETINDPWWTWMWKTKNLNLHGIDEDYTETRKDDRARVMGILNEFILEQQQIKPHMSKFRSAPTIHVQTDFKFDTWYTTPKKRRTKKDATGQVENGGDGPEKAGLKDALKYIKELLDKEPDETDPQRTGAFRNLMREIQVKYTHKGDLRRDPVEFGRFDKDEYRLEFRNEVRSDSDGPDGTWHNCLRTQQWLPRNGTISGVVNDQDADYETRIHYATKRGEGVNEVKVGGYRSFRGVWHKDREEQTWNLVDSHESTQWGGDEDLLEPGISEVSVDSKMTVAELQKVLKEKGLDTKGKKAELISRLSGVASVPIWGLLKQRPFDEVQYRRKQQSRFFITYTLHRASQGPEARLLLEKMANGLYAVFGRDDLLSELIVFGQKIVNVKTGKAIHKNSNAAKNKDALDKLDRDSYGAGMFGRITKPNKEEKIPEFYANGLGSSYVSDTYDTHIHSVDVNAGVEIGPKRHHPHFHLLLTIEHWSVIQIDYFKMRQMLEMLFRGQPAPNWFKGGEALDSFIEKTYHLTDNSGGEFMSDAENPWVDIRLYPQDNWEDIIDDYTNKSSGGVIDSALSRLGPAVGRDAVRDLNAQLQASADAANTFQP